MDKYTYPLFFEVKGLSGNDIQDIWRYFQRGEDSGGGECGIPAEVEGNTYKICFKDKEGIFFIYVNKNMCKQFKLMLIPLWPCPYSQACI